MAPFRLQVIFCEGSLQCSQGWSSLEKETSFEIDVHESLYLSLQLSASTQPQQSKTRKNRDGHHPVGAYKDI